MERRIAELHIIEARRCALRLICTTSTILPDEWGQSELTEMAMLDVTEFAMHARRVSDICDLKDEALPDASICRYKISEPAEMRFLENYHHALNRFLHAKKVVVGYTVWDGPKVYLASEINKVLTYVTIETDERPAEHISIYGVAHCFLTGIISAVKQRYPEFRF